MADREPAFCEQHCSYLLRLWRTSADGGWRASLHTIPADERHMFADLESLLAFLSGRAGVPPDDECRGHSQDNTAD